MKKILPLLLISTSLFSYEIGEWVIRENLKGRHYYENGKKFIAEMHFQDERVKERTHLYSIQLPSLEDKDRTSVTLTFNKAVLVGVDCHRLGKEHQYGVSDFNGDGILDCLSIWNGKEPIGTFTITNGQVEPLDEKTNALWLIGGNEAIDALVNLINKRLEPADGDNAG